MSAWIRSITGRAYQFRLHSSKHQSGRVLSVRLSVRIRLGTPRGCGSTAECGRAKAETTVRLRSPAPIWGRSSTAERSDMREVKRAARFAPTICPCGVVQSTCLPLMQEITGAKPVRDANFRRVVRGEQQTHLIQNQAALDVQVVSRRPVRPQSIVSDAFAR